MCCDESHELAAMKFRSGGRLTVSNNICIQNTEAESVSFFTYLGGSATLFTSVKCFCERVSTHVSSATVHYVQ
jgi:hypothetical protein